ncbi:MAG: phosphoribosylaminoimidazolesuccinocarboxamide synthase [Thiotrichaceae bacterium]
MNNLSSSPAVFDTQLEKLPLIHRGKVRDIYDVDDHHMLIVTTDRLSAFDVVLPDPIPEKGKVLTEVSDFWFDKLDHIVPNQLSTMSLDDLDVSHQEKEILEGRSTIVKKLKALPVEAIVRGYLIGSGWKDYQRTGSVCGIELPENLQQASQLPEAIYTPSTKAGVGGHDENIAYEQTVELLGEDLAKQVKETSLNLYKAAAEFALEKGIIIADTKFEFGLDSDDNLVLIDEALTPDSSRFWPVSEYQEGMSPPSFDKQFIRDYLETLDWDKTSPGPSIPKEVIEKSAAKYKEIANLLMT